jgi:hypothetical protein
MRNGWRLSYDVARRTAGIGVRMVASRLRRSALTVALEGHSRPLAQSSWVPSG